ncbi:MAG: peptide-methionine (S)-S-oxide reductase MsrA [Bacteroidota bacterium]
MNHHSDPNQIDPTKTSKTLAIATFGNGCFWCTEAVFQSLEGVHKVVSGYSGGHVENPTYEEVCGKMTGHAEVIQITYDPAVINYEDLLEVFWYSHDPTTLNRQGNDVGPQYRSAIFYHDEEQRTIAEASLRRTDASDAWSDPIVTEITAFDRFYPAESYHQDYYNRVGARNPYCTFNITPKLMKVRRKFGTKLKREV